MLDCGESVVLGLPTTYTPNVSGENPKKLKTRKQPDGVADVLREIQVGLRPG